MGDEPKKIKSGEYADVELEQLSESVRSLEHAIWIAAGAFFAILGFGLNWMYQSADDAVLAWVIFAGLIALELAGVLLAHTWVNGSVRLMKRMAELCEVLDMDPGVPRDMMRARRKAEKYSWLVVGLTMAVTTGLFYASQRKARTEKSKSVSVRVIGDSTALADTSHTDNSLYNHVRSPASAKTDSLP